jgi:hypothetical protein
MLIEVGPARQASEGQHTKMEMIQRVMNGTLGMDGELRAIAGKSLKEIEGLEMKALEGPTIA